MNGPAIDYLDVDDLLEIAAGVLAEVAIRDVGLLASAAARPRTAVFGQDAYPDLATKAAALLHSVTRNHPLVDGNKRLGWSAMRAFLILNGVDLGYTVDEAESFVLGVAAGNIDVPEGATWVEERLLGGSG